MVSQAGAVPGYYRLPQAAASLEPLYRSLYRLTEGAMTPLITGSLEHLGYDADYTLRAQPGFLPSPDWAEAIDWHGTRLQTKQPVVLDVGAAGKGQLVDLLAAELERHGVGNYVIDASGDLFAQGLTLRVGLEHPLDPSTAIGVVELDHGYPAICASASNRRSWGAGLHHVLDGSTGKPVQTVLASWALAQDAMQADALATALFFTDHATLAKEFDFASVRMFSTGRAEISDNFDGEIF
ncbi:thiamine biosynthesis lipoprotein [Psychromicrobium silvestre]|uniref:FAD:protein FMN transferase n=1 Tax=Psychromicrobium silvestre TaxID=1645614 RepID=A0A7Y9S7S7_9MICC|nr:thiamine biosynthesis lipoprotein [Psychromicrobium silvestre]